MADEPLALLRPDPPAAGALLPFLERIDANGWFTNFGPLSRELEQTAAEMLSAGGVSARVTAVSSGTLGLELALGALGLDPGARVLMPSLAFPAPATAVRRMGFEPVFADVDARCWQIQPDRAREFADDIDAVVPVATFGRPCDIDAWDEFSAATGLPVIVDAAGAFGNQRPGARVPVVFSLHATKALAAGEGGIVAAADDGFVERVRVASNFGFAGGVIESAGTNAKLSEYHAAVALAALAAWPEQLRRRLDLADGYARALAPMLAGRVELHDNGAAWVRSVFVVRVPTGVRAESLAALARLGIEARRWYCPPLHAHPAFAACRRVGDMAVTDALADELLGLPFHLRLPDDAPERVAAALDAILPPAARRA